jgi:predicted porin
MKNFLFTAVALASSAAAFAQSNATIYGTLDLGLWHQSKTPAGSPNLNGGSVTSVNTGGTAPSVLGVRGEEALGGDLKATFNLETHLDPSVGSSGLGTFWSRAANVGLAGSWGAVKMGQQLMPGVLGYAATDPRGFRESLSGVQPWSTSSLQNMGPGTASPNNTLAFFASNSISYQGAYKDLSGGLLYSAGEVSGNAKANEVVSGQLTYAGPITLSTSYQHSNWASTGERSDQKASLGAAITLGSFNLKANYLKTKAFTSAGVLSGDWSVVGLGGDFKVSEHQLITAAYYRGKNSVTANNDNKADSFIVSGEQTLSKRTILYAQLAAIRAGDSADGVVSVLGSQPVQGATTLVMNLGIRHRF